MGEYIYRKQSESSNWNSDSLFKKKEAAPLPKHSPILKQNYLDNPKEKLTPQELEFRQLQDEAESLKVKQSKGLALTASEQEILDYVLSSECKPREKYSIPQRTSCIIVAVTCGLPDLRLMGASKWSLANVSMRL